MAELNLQQIIDRLNAEFTGDTRKLVFWYDDNADFAEEIPEMVLDHAKVYFLRPDNQFYTKYFLEREDTATNYLIYAPFPKPDVRDNHLEDTLLYSRRFYADRASLLCVDLGISDKDKPVIEKHMGFFGDKELTKRFYELEIEYFTEETILTGMICAICRTRTCSFEEAVRMVFTEGELEGNAYLEEMDQYGLTGAFWELCEQQFGYKVNCPAGAGEGGLGHTDTDPTLEKLLMTMFVTYTDKYVQAALPKAWNPFVSFKSGNIIAFLDSLMYSIRYREKYDALSDHVATGLNVRSAFSKLMPEDMMDCDTFRVIDERMIGWLVERLVAEDTGANLNGQGILQVCESRRKLHFGKQNEDCYLMLESAYRLVCAGNYHSPDGFANVIRTYREKDFSFDQEYRHFYYHYDRLDDTADFEELRTLVENIYTNEYLATLLPAWNEGLLEPESFTEVPLQRNFYTHFVKPAMEKERTVVIISDAMRYEVGQELFLRMQDDPRSTVKMKTMLSVLPSYTRLGMAALLPHRTLTITDDYKVLADDTLCDTLEKRQTVLQSHCANSVCVQFDGIKMANREKLRSVFSGKQVVYVYHNQIDARGDKANTEDEVFIACEEAIQEIMDLVRRISNNANTYRFLVTADHGFIYKRDRLTESDKVSPVGREDGLGRKVDFAVSEREGGLGHKVSPAGREDGLDHKMDAGSKKAFVNRRFVVAREPVSGDGVQHMCMGRILGNDDEKIVSFPVGSNVFKVAGGGANYVHGGSSPQEMLVPVIDIKMERGHMETRPAQIALVSIVPKITNLIISMDFIQSDAVTDTVKGTTYRLYFISEDGERISNENILAADSRETDAAKRMTRLRFTFKNQKYDRNRQYYLVAFDESTGLEAWRHSVIVDLAFGDDFGFGF